MGVMFENLDVVMPDESFDGPMQMSLDEILLKRVSRPMLRFYKWNVPCVTFGYFQSHALVSELHSGLPLVRRWTGGGAVIHGEDLTFSLMIPPGNPVSAMTSPRFYREFHGAVAKVLGGKLAGEEDITRGPFCFSAPSMDDLMVGSKKVLGGAIRRSGGALLYQGSLVVQPGGFDDDVGSLKSALCDCCVIGVLAPDVIAGARVMAEERYATAAWNRRL
jgi:lipoyl(octanoyl) transferase